MTGRRNATNGNLAEQVYGHLREGIVAGRYRPEQRLVETELASELDASRTPIRQALQRLELQGLVSASRHGWTVRSHSIGEIVRIYHVRIALEGYASRLAAEHASDEAIRDIRRRHDEMATEHGEGGGRFVERHDRFHGAIFAAADNDVLETGIQQYREHRFNKRVAHAYSRDELVKAAESHAELMAALEARDADRAERITRDHLAIALDAAVRLFKAGVY